MRKVLVFLAALILASCGAQPDGAPTSASPPPDPGPPSADAVGWVDAERLSSDAAGGAMWMTTGGDAHKTHFSRLDLINRDNVETLGLAWEYETFTTRGLEATPIVVDGVMFTSGIKGIVYALDARTGEELWFFEPDVDMQVNRWTCCDMVNRGVAVWEGAVYVAALDGILYALDAANGEVLWQVDTIVDHSRGYSSTGAPQIAGDVVVIGNGGAEFDVRGYVTAYDLKSGEEAWRFYTVPRDPELGQESEALERVVDTWDPNSRWDIGAGGTVWDGLAYDSEHDLVYLGVGNGGPYPRAVRSPSGGDNLYLSSIVALKASTGDYVWHYQTTPGDSWDFTASQPMVLADLEIDGQQRAVIMQAPKNGFFFVLDRVTGEFISATPIVYQNWADGIDPETGAVTLSEGKADYWNGPRIIYPAVAGAHNWHPMSWNPETGLVYIGIQEMGNLMFLGAGLDVPHKPKRLNASAAMIFSPQVELALPSLPPPLQEAVQALPEFQDKERMQGKGKVIAFDPVAKVIRWSALTSGDWDRGGVLSTAGGLVFVGSSTGALNVFDADTGETLASLDVGTSIMAAPMTYELDGEQYVSVMAAWGGGGWSFPKPETAQYTYGNYGRILTFKLGAPAPTLPEPLPDTPPIPEPPEQFGTPEMIAMGGGLFSENCMLCHSNMERANIANLTYMSAATHEVFDDILLEGVLLPLGMPRWDDAFTPEEVQAIHAFLIDNQANAYDRQQRGETEEQRASVLSGN